MKPDKKVPKEVIEELLRKTKVQICDFRLKGEYLNIKVISGQHQFEVMAKSTEGMLEEAELYLKFLKGKLDDSGQ